jgi:hypothetical protein
VQPLITSNSVTITGQPYGNGLWTMDSSTALAGYEAWRAFSSITSDSFATASQTYSPASRGNYTGIVTSTLANGTNIRGEWIQIDLPEAIVLKSYSLRGRPEITWHRTRMPRDFVMLGSNTGATTWNVLDTRANTTFTSAAEVFPTTQNSVRYSRYRLSVQSVSNLGATSAASDMFNMQMFLLNGLN